MDQRLLRAPRRIERVKGRIHAQNRPRNHRDRFHRRGMQLGIGDQEGAAGKELGQPAGRDVASSRGHCAACTDANAEASAAATGRVQRGAGCRSMRQVLRRKAPWWVSSHAKGHDHVHVHAGEVRDAMRSECVRGYARTAQAGRRMCGVHREGGAGLRGQRARRLHRRRKLQSVHWLHRYEQV